MWTTWGEAGVSLWTAVNMPVKFLIARYAAWCVPGMTPSTACGQRLPGHAAMKSHRHSWQAAPWGHLVALVRAGATFINAKPIGRPGGNAQPEAA
jgi:hypothetical protein